MARTRSQPISPGGYQSLPDKPKRRMRGTSTDEEKAPAEKKQNISEKSKRAPTTLKSAPPTSTSRRRVTRSASIEVEVKVPEKKNQKTSKSAPAPAPTPISTTTSSRRVTRSMSIDEEKVPEVKNQNTSHQSVATTTTSTKTRPRTRSQPQSPGGMQVLLEKPRQRRSASVEQPEKQLPVAKKAPVKKSAGRKTRVTKKRAPKAKTSNKPSDMPVSDAKKTKTRTDEALRPVSATPIRRKTASASSRRRRSNAEFDVPRTLFHLQEALEFQDMYPKTPTREENKPHHQVASANASPHTPPPASPVNQTPPPPRTAPASTAPPPTNQRSPGWSLRNIYNSVTRRWGTIKNRMRRGSIEVLLEAPPTSSERMEVVAPEPQSPQQAPIVDSEPFPPVTEDMARGSPSRPNNPPPARSRQPKKHRYDWSARSSGFRKELLESMREENKYHPSPPDRMDLDNASEEAPELPKKRKRSTSPDVIPNPEGCSYGMADGYFDYDSDDEREAMEEQARRDAVKYPDEPPAKKQKQEVPEARRRQGPPSRFQAPQRFEGATELSPILSSEFLSEGEFGPQPTQRKTPRPTLTPETPYGISSTDNEGGDASSSPIILGKAGPTITFEVPYSSSSDDVDGGAPALSSGGMEESQLGHHPGPSSSSMAPQTGSSPVSRARNRAEQYKPKTPSRLRQTDQTSPYTSKSDQTPPCTATINKHNANMPPTAGTPQWLKIQCPAGDFSTLPWPEFKPTDNMFSLDAMRLVQSKWTANSGKAVQYWDNEIKALCESATPSGENGLAPLTLEWPAATPIQDSFSDAAINAVNFKWSRDNSDSIDHWRKEMKNL